MSNELTMEEIKLIKHCLHAYERDMVKQMLEKFETSLNNPALQFFQKEQSYINNILKKLKGE